MGAVGAADGVRVRLGPAAVQERSARGRSSCQRRGARRCTSAIARSLPSSPRAGEVEKAVYEFNWLAATGTGIFLAAVAVGGLAGHGAAAVPALFWRHAAAELRWPLFTIACMLAIAFTTRYSGMDATLGLAFTRTGVALPALRGPAGLARRRPDRLGHVVQRPVRQPADDHRPPAGRRRRAAADASEQAKSCWRRPTAPAASWAR